MLFSINQTNSDGSNVVKIIGASEDNQIDSIVSVINMISNTTLFLKFASQYGLKLALCPGDKRISIITDSDVRFTNVTSVYTTIDKYLTDNNLEQLPTAISQKLISALTQMPDVTEAIAITIVSLCLAYRSYLRSDDGADVISIGMDYYAPQYFNETKEYIDSLNESAIWPFTKISVSENKTLPMKDCTDPLFIEIPMRQLLMDDDVNVKSFLPKKNTFYHPYGAATLDDMTLYKEPESKFPKELIPMVEGDVHNNELAIQENEQKYYDALIEWVQFNMKADAGTDIDVSPSNPNIDAVSQVYLDSLCEMLYGWNWDHNPNIPEYNADNDEPEYLDDTQAEDGIKSSYVYKATKREKAAMDAGVDLNSVHEVHINAIEILKDYLREASLNLGYKVYVEAAIKLARWGSRKPTALYFEDYPLIFNLGTNKVSQYIGYIDNYELQKQNDCEATAICAIYDNTMFNDKGYLRSFSYESDRLLAPIGLFGQKIYTNKSDMGPEELKFEQYYSLIDVVRSYVTGSDEFKIDGVEYDGTTFKTTKNIVCDEGIVLSKIMFQYKANKSNWMLNPFCAAESLQNLYLDLGVTQGTTDAPLHHFTLLQSKQRVADLRKDISINKFDSKEDLMRKREDRTIRLLRYAVETGVASVILPVFIVASKLYADRSESERTFADVLNIYKEAMLQCDYFDEAGFMSKYSRIGNPKSIREVCDYAANEASANMQNMNLFASTTENASAANVEQKTDTVEQKQVATEENVTSVQKSGTIDTSSDNVDATQSMSFIKNITDDDNYFVLVDGAGAVAGGCAVRDTTIMFRGAARKKKVFIFVTKDKMDTISPERIIKTHSFKQVIGLIIDDLLVYESGHYDRVSAYFDDLSTIKYYRDKVKTMLDASNI